MKKSFLMYIDWYDIIADLSEEQLGKLIKAAFLYNSGQDPEAANMDAVTRREFKHWQKAFDRDAEKYQQRCNKNRENIKIRWQRKRQQDAKKKSFESGYPIYPEEVSESEIKRRIEKLK